MKKDTEIRLYLQERKKGMTQRVAAARAGIAERTARRYERAGALPSQLKRPHGWKTRLDPFEQDWRLPSLRSWSVIQPFKVQRSLPCSVNDTLIAIDLPRCAPCSAISSSGASYMDLIVR